MPYYKFTENDIFHNRLVAHPKKDFFLYNSSIYLDNQSQISGAFTGSVPNVPPGYANLYELNVDRTASVTGRTIGPVSNTGLIFPFTTRNGSLVTFRTVGTGSFFSTEMGTTILGAYPLSASISRQLFEGSTTRSASANRINALSNTLNYYTPYSENYAFSSSVGGTGWDKGTQAINLISIPSIFYGSSIKKGSLDLKFYISGTLIGHLRDERYNGDLVQVAPAGSTGSGSVAGVALYNEGFLLLTGSWNLDGDGFGGLDYTDANKETHSSWLYYGVGTNDGIPADTDSIPITRLSASYTLALSGTNYIPTVTMFAHAPQNQLNYSTNASYLDQSSAAAFLFESSSLGYVESTVQTIKNTIKSSYVSPTASYKPQTFISKVGIFDKEKNLIGIAKIATPVKKTEDRDLTFKLKLDF